jgi:iron complex outermembrane receptor protein
MRAQGTIIPTGKCDMLKVRLKFIEMRYTFAILLSLGPISLAFTQSAITGRVIDAESQEALIGATVQIRNTYLATTTNPDGQFKFSAKSPSSGQLIVSYLGFEKDTFTYSGSNAQEMLLQLSPRTFQNETVLINASRVDANDPATVVNVSKEEIEDVNLGQDIPFILQQTPSVVATSDAGAGVGYTGMRIRGSDASRINVTVNGIPLNDAESHGVFWVNMPDLASSLQSVQIQRGLGYSTNGAGAFGATVNLQTNTVCQKPYGVLDNSFGSFNTRKHTIMAGSGLMKNNFSFDVRLSNLQSDGYIDRASSDLKSYYISGGYYGKKTTLKAITFGGKEITYQSWYGTPESRFEDDGEGMLEHAANEGLSPRRTLNLLTAGRTYNYYLYENQVDNYRQDHYQLHLSHEFNPELTANFSLHYTIGEGYFEEFKSDQDFADYRLGYPVIGSDTVFSTDLIRRRWLDNDFYGFTYSVLYSPADRLNFTLGGGLNRYEGDHFGEIIWAEFASEGFPGRPYYFNDATKTDGNMYLKVDYRLTSQTSFLLDLQVRHIDYETQGRDNDQRLIDIDENYTFLNPKLGVNHEFDPNTRLYLFSGIGHREPNRADLVDQDTLANKAEQMINLELGFEKKYKRFYFLTNLFWMQYRDQLVLTGELNDVGSPVRQNVDHSFRRGIEIQAAYKLTDAITLSGNATFSQNKIEDYTEIIYDYTDGFYIWEIDHGQTDIALSPGIIANAQLVYEPNEQLEMALISRYIGDQYLDNTSRFSRKLAAYWVSDFRAEYRFKTKKLEELSVQLLVNNLFSEDYASNGYTYSYVYGSMITENFYYPQAFRNYLVGLKLAF